MKKYFRQIKIRRGVSDSAITFCAKITIFRFRYKEFRIVWYPKSKMWAAQYKLKGKFIANSFEPTRKEALSSLRYKTRMAQDPKFKAIRERLDSAKGDGDSRGRRLGGLQSTGAIMDELVINSPIWKNIVADIHK